MFVVYHSVKVHSEKFGTYTKETKLYEGTKEACENFIQNFGENYKHGELSICWYCF